MHAAHSAAVNSDAPRLPKTRRLATFAAARLLLSLAFMIGFVFAMSSASAASASTSHSRDPLNATASPLDPAAPQTCSPKVRPWTFEASNNYAAPNPGGRYTKVADGCQSVWWVGNDSTVTLSVAETRCNGTGGPCDTIPVTCNPGYVCQLWNPAADNDPFYVFEPYSKHSASGTLYF